MSDAPFHPKCEVCGKYIFAVDGCPGPKGPRQGDLTLKEKQKLDRFCEEVMAEARADEELCVLMMEGLDD